MTVDPFLLRGAAIGVDLAGRARRRGRRRLSRRRGRPAPDRLGPAGRRHPARPRAVGAAGGVPALARQPVRPAPPGAAAARGGGGHRRQRGDGAPRPAACSGSGGSRLRVVPLAPAAGVRARPPVAAAPAPRAAGSASGSSGSGSTDRYLVFSGRFDARLDLDDAPVAPSRALARAGPARRARRRTSPWPPRVLLVGASPDDRASVARAAARKGVGESLAYAPGLAGRGPGRARPWRAGGGPARRLRGGRAAGHRGDRLRDAGRRVRGRAAARAGRPGRAAGRTARSRTGWPSPWRRSGPTTTSTTGSPPALESAPRGDADLGRRRRARRGRSTRRSASGRRTPADRRPAQFGAGLPLGVGVGGRRVRCRP